MLFRLACVLVIFLLPMHAFSASTSNMIDKKIARLQALDKTTAKTLVFNVEVGSTVQMGKLFIRAAACIAAPPLEDPESAAFIQVWEEPKPMQEPNWVFSGWMFASSPSLSAMDHPVYDVWVIECVDDDV